MSWGQSLVVVSGASRGFGAALCEGLVPELGAGSVVLGLARDGQQLAQVKERLIRAAAGVKFVCVVMDLVCPDMAVLQAALKEAVGSGGGWQSALMVHNAGSLQHLQHMVQLDHFQHISEYFNLNVSSLFPLNAAFLQQVQQLRPSNPGLAVKVVNVSSLCAVQPMKSWSLYCTGKAARDMAFSVLAAEEPEVKVLSYAPGPLDTDMQRVARDETGDPSLRSSFVSMQQQGTLLTAQQSVEKLLQLLRSGGYTSGAHVDYYDV